MTAKLYKRYLTVIISIGLLAGCGRQEAPGVLSPRQKLTIAINLTEEERLFFGQHIFPEFEKQHRISVRELRIDPGHLVEKLEASRASDSSEIDLFALDSMETAIITGKGLALDLSGYEGQIPEEVPRNMIEFCKLDGKLMFMPFRPDVQIMYYNYDAFSSYGLAAPQRWGYLLELAQKFKESEGEGRVLLKASGGDPTAIQIYEFILQADGDPYAFDDIGCIQTFRFLQKLWQYTSKESLEAGRDATNDIFAKQEVYLAQNWSSNIIALNSRELPFRFMTFSGLEGPAGEHHVIGGEVFGIPGASKNAGSALRFIEYIQSKKVQEVLVSELGWPSMREDAYEQTVADSYMRAHYVSIKKALKRGVFRKSVTWWPAYAKYINEAFREIVVGGAPVEETLTKYKEKLEDEKSAYR